MKTLITFGDVLFFVGGFAACWFFKAKIVAAIDWIKAKF